MATHQMPSFELKLRRNAWAVWALPPDPHVGAYSTTQNP